MYGLISYEKKQEITLNLSSPFWADIQVLANELDSKSSGSRLANSIQLADKISCTTLVKKGSNTEINENFKRLLASSNGTSSNMLSLHGFKEEITFKLDDSGQEVVIEIKGDEEGYTVAAYDSLWNTLHKGNYHTDNAVVLHTKDLSPLILKLFNFMSLEYYDLLINEEYALKPLITAAQLKADYSSYLAEIAGRLGHLDRVVKKELTFWYITLEKLRIKEEVPADINNEVAEKVLNVITGSLKPLCRLLDLYYGQPKSNELDKKVETSNLFGTK